ncbi:MAG: UbiX family flavin prenyltransferase [Planctomycetes bacterium]|nr:UbiX family flavin prenyltransferase [Planctomycetota bacterium]
MMRVVVGLSGGSGAAYAQRLLEVLLQGGHEVHLIVTTAGLRVLRYEAGLEVEPDDLDSLVRVELREHLVTYGLDSVEAMPASGSANIDAVVICPCSMGTLARVAHGFSSNLLERAADVALKEGRRLVVVPRETPLSVVHLRNMLALAEAGAVVLPAMPGFYHRPARVEDLVDFVVARILDRIGVEHELVRRWATPEPGGACPWDEGEV